MLTKFLPFRLRSRINTRRHDAACRPVLGTAPIVPADDGLVIFSMMGTAVLLPYLIAVKSLWSHLRRGRVVILSDGTLTPGDRAVLAHHCGNPQIIDIADVDTTGFPVGGTWERLLTILDMRRDDYMIQLDSDTVTLGYPDVVADAIAANISFTLLGGAEWEIGAQTCTAFTPPVDVPASAQAHIQTRMERVLAKIADSEKLRYIRGCSGFTGFARGGDGRALAAHFAREMQQLLGTGAMHEWGTEQVTSSFVIANDPGAVLLPYRQYGNYWGDPWDSDCRFMHFVGAHRHDGSAYRDATAAALARMGS
ncbi:hypothetical protein [Blastomonas aquatica]|uniref:Nucleotide-diphospho-sugar transferase domain-containing protein n=1 Tax=Blastomonas aquatica TaxID=1510276 RepID=A0ABQ1JNQ0_9SPHN|nr:hypothetical protein [Blastomonas aquatica]GGB70873.1 hypothetical protein GCM10010833_27650 [Blastomonas aquatica]